MFYILAIFTSSIFPEQGNIQHNNMLHEPRIIPDIIGNKLNDFISKFTIKLVPKKYSYLIKNRHISSNTQPNSENKKSSTYMKVSPNNRNTDFVFYTTFSILCLSVLALFYIFVYQITNRNQKIIEANEAKKY